MATKVPSNLDIAQAHTLEPIADIAERYGLEPDEYDLYGRYKAKVDLSVIDRLAGQARRASSSASRRSRRRRRARARRPRPSRSRRGSARSASNPVLCLREPSLGPVFGIKGGAAGGGYAQVVPMEDLNLHFTGDIHAIGAANNLLAAALEAHLLHGNKLGIDPLTIGWRRCVDMNDRSLRQIVVGLGGRANGYPRETGLRHHRRLRGDGDRRRLERPPGSAQAPRRDHRRLHLRGRARRRPTTCRPRAR